MTVRPAPVAPPVPPARRGRRPWTFRVGLAMVVGAADNEMAQTKFDADSWIASYA